MPILHNRKFIGEWLLTRKNFKRYMEMFYNQSKSSRGSSFAGKMLIKGWANKSYPTNEEGKTMYAAASTELLGELYILAIAISPASLIICFSF